MSDLGSLCGLCFSNFCEEVLLDTTDKNHPFMEKCKFLFSQQITVESFVWKKACVECITKIDEIYEFFQKVIKNHEKLVNSNFSSQQSESENDIVYLSDMEFKEEILSNESECEDELNCEPSVDVVGGSDSNLTSNNVPNISNTNDCKEDRNLSSESDRSVEQDLNIDEDSKNENLSEDIELPDHLKTRMPKEACDATIRSFMEIKCEMCTNNEKFNTFNELQHHYERQHSTRGFVKCCDRKIFRKDRLVDHIILHMNPDAFKCPTCGQRTKSKSLLRAHMKQHLPFENRPYPCNVCDQRFVLKSQLNNHRAKHLSAEERKYICDECGKAFALNFVLNKHKATHNSTKPYFCEVCAQAFSSRINLESHARTHEKEPGPRLQCKICGQWYKNVQTLRTHYHRHRDTRDHTCKICNRKCTSNSSLSQHTRYVHHRISNFKCNICQKQFRRKPELTDHIARHTGEVLYQCQFCSKTFAFSSNYFAHRKAKHSKEYAALINQQQTKLQNNLQ